MEAEQFLENMVYITDDGEPRSVHDSIESVKSAMVEYAKYHVQEALKEALESIPCLGSSSDIATYEEVEEEVLKSYPFENIK